MQHIGLTSDNTVAEEVLRDSAITVTARRFLGRDGINCEFEKALPAKMDWLVEDWKATRFEWAEKDWETNELERKIGGINGLRAAHSL